MRLRYTFLSALVALLVAAAPSAFANHLYVAGLAGANEVPAVSSAATGTVIAEIGDDGATVTVTGSFSGLEGDYAASHIHLGVAGVNGGVIFPLAPTLDAGNRGGSFEAANNTFTFSADEIAALENDGLYINIHSAFSGSGEIRGQLGAPENALVITGVIDGPLAGGTPKAIELFVTEDVADLGLYGVGSANNGGGTDGNEFQLTGSASAGDFLYVASEADQFTAFFGFAPTFTSGAASINGDDAIELFYAPGGADGVVIDVFGEIDVDGSGQPWEHTDGWVYRVSGTGPDGSTFEVSNFTYSGVGALNGATTNATAATPFPIGSYQMGTANEREAIASGMEIRVPNPLAGSATVRYAVGAAGPARLEAFDLLGRRVALVAEGVVSGDVQAATLDATALPAGLYVLRLTGQAGVVTRTVTVVR